jgi:hypothetical protein
MGCAWRPGGAGGAQWPVAPSALWRSVTKPLWCGRMGACELTGTHVMGRCEPLASGPYQSKLFSKFKININFKIQNEGLPNVEKYSNFS